MDRISQRAPRRQQHREARVSPTSIVTPSSTTTALLLLLLPFPSAPSPSLAPPLPPDVMIVMTVESYPCARGWRGWVGE